MQHNIEELKQEYQELGQKLAQRDVISDPEQLKKYSQRYREIHNLIQQHEKLQAIDARIRDNQTILQGDDEELKQIAQEEIEDLTQQHNTIEQSLTLNKEPYSTINEVIIEIRPGVGGEESSLFAQDLLRMYVRYAERSGCRATIIEQNQSELRGIKEAVLEIKGKNIYSLLKHESGVHRVQRIPETEKSGRIHTSTASVAVLPKAKKIDIDIKPEDIKMEAFRSSGPGGQNVNKVSTAIRITHIPSGMSVASQQGRSQAANRETALMHLRSRLLQEKIEEEEQKRKAQRQEQIGRAERSEKIRTYNFPQNRVTDHRVATSWHNIVDILDGDLDAIISTLHTTLP